MRKIESRRGQGRRDPSVCTIISKNYLAYARVLANSFLEHHPGGRVFVLLVDRLEGEFLPESEPFTLIEVEELDTIPELPSFLFKYSLLECNTAAKPFLLEYLLDTFGLDDLIYLDPDILVLREFEALWPLLRASSIVITPHMTQPVDDGCRPGEIEILLAGIYNLGFIAIRDTDTTRRFLRWWQDRLHERCVSAQSKGLFVDQRWIDLILGYFEGVHILREPGYNVAYWNLHERKVARSDPDGFRVNGQPLYFFHFSGIELDRMEGVSKHQNRFELAELGEAASLFYHYRDRLVEAGHEVSSRWRYTFGYYDDGRPISNRARRHYRELGPKRRRFGNPFRTGSILSFRVWYHGADLPHGVRQIVYYGLLAFHSRFGRSVRRVSRRLLEWRERSSDPTVRTQGLPTGSSVGAEQGAAAETRVRTKGHLARPGVNIVGYLTAETGMGTVARSIAAALETVPIRYSLQNIELNVRSRRKDSSFGDLSSNFPYDVNLFCVNADQVPAVLKHLGLDVLEGRRNVGYWLWEVARFPSSYLKAFEPFDEIWTPSSHCVEAISSVSSIPVRRVPLPVAVADAPCYDRAHFEIPEAEFALVFAFDFLSIWERKNPRATIEAFRRAFSKDEPARLIIKSSNSGFDAEGREQIRQAIGDAKVTWIDRTLSEQEVRDLFRVCDCYVSLHRAEGFGLTIAESMAMGKPVIATAYSGNVDFFNLNNGWPVRYDLVELEEAVGPYPAGTVWADPDVDHAATQMRRVYDDPKDRERRTRRARKDVRRYLSREAVGAILAERRRVLTGQGLARQRF